MVLSLEKELRLFLLCHLSWLLGLAPALHCGFLRFCPRSPFLHPSRVWEGGRIITHFKMRFLSLLQQARQHQGLGSHTIALPPMLFTKQKSYLQLRFKNLSFPQIVSFSVLRNFCQLLSTPSPTPVPLQPHLFLSLPMFPPIPSLKCVSSSYSVPSSACPSHQLWHSHYDFPDSNLSLLQISSPLYHRIFTVKHQFYLAPFLPRHPLWFSDENSQS